MTAGTKNSMVGRIGTHQGVHLTMEIICAGRVKFECVRLSKPIASDTKRFGFRKKDTRMLERKPEHRRVQSSKPVNRLWRGATQAVRNKTTCGTYKGQRRRVSQSYVDRDLSTPVWCPQGTRGASKQHFPH